MKLSLIYNLDTRKGWRDKRTSLDQNDGGCRSEDFFIYGLENKRNFINDKKYETEVIVYVDVHEPLTPEIEDYLHMVCDKLIIMPHTPERYGKAYRKNNNDLIYAEVLSLATGDYVIHFDADTFCYRNDTFDATEYYISLLDKYKYVCMPSNDSPYVLSRGHELMKGLGYQWASTRFFICKRETLPDINELTKCFDNKYLKEHYGKVARPNCVEHILGVMAGEPREILYPFMRPDDYLMFSWGTYYKGIYEYLSILEYNDIKKYIMEDCNNAHFWYDCHAVEKENL